jgi:Skp family chaperone for outer membrane proteins
MKNFLRKILPAVLLMTVLSGSALAQTKIATVDLHKLFDNYYKTKLAKADIEARKAQLEKDDKAYLDDYKKASDEYQQLLGQENDPVISSDERDRRKQAAADKLKELQDRKTAIDQYERTAQSTLAELLQRMRDKVLVDIKDHVNTAAKAGGYALVIDISAQGITSTDIVLYHSDENDLTDEVLKQLNAGAPVDTTTPAVTVPSPLLMGTNSP